MPEEKVNLVDDFLVDVDIETIDLDVNEIKDLSLNEESQQSFPTSEEVSFDEIKKDVGIDIEDIGYETQEKEESALQSLETTAPIEEKSKKEILPATETNLQETEKEEIAITLEEQGEISPLNVEEDLENINLSIEQVPEAEMEGFTGAAEKEVIEQLEEIKEPELPLEEEVSEEKMEATSEVPAEMEEPLVSIDGSELDRLIYESGISLGSAEEIPQETPAEPKIEGEVLETIEEINLTEVPIMEEEVQETEEKLEEVFQEEEKELITPEETLGEKEVSKLEETTKQAEEEFSFDLSVIPDVAEVEEDEPIALSLEELNNIEVSEENVVEYSPPLPEAEPEVSPVVSSTEEVENIEIPIEELTEVSETSIKEPYSLEVYGAEEVKLEEEGIKPSEVEEIFEEPVAKAFSETGEITLEEKIEALSPETKEELKVVLKYLDELLESLPPEKIKEFAKSEYYDLYIKILDKLGI